MNKVRKMIMLLAVVMVVGLLTVPMLVMPVAAQNQPPHTPIFTQVPPNQPPHTPVPAATGTIVPTRAPLVITMTQDEINTAFTPVYSTTLMNVVVTLGTQQVFIDFVGIGPNFKKQQFNAVAVPQSVEVVGKVTWIVTDMTIDGQPMEANLFRVWSGRVHNMLDARMPKRYKGYIVTSVDITPDLLTYTEVLR
ncbi:MAG: hypothetical protein H0X30_18600 [Anaerolineae bacterium]|nr:hypothetical protein [Anaerolineae bacterium]